MKGSYILLIKLSEEQTIDTVKLKAIHFLPGYYAYVGSGMGGLEARLKRHTRREKKLHWHIDYLLEKAQIDDIIVCESRERTECRIARAMVSQFSYIPGFGASDCRCRSHLFFATAGMKPGIAAVLGTLGVESKLVRELPG